MDFSCKTWVHEPLCDIGCCLCCSCFSCGISVVFFSRQQPQLSWAGCDLALHRGSFKHIRPVELPGDGWSRWNLATFLVRWGASQIEWGTGTKSQQEFKASMYVAMSETWWKDLVWSYFAFIVFSPFDIFSWSWIKKFLGHLETFSASSKDLLPKRFMYRKLMPDIFCHQEPQMQIKCQKSAKVVTGRCKFPPVFLCHIYIYCPGPLIPCFSCHLATDQQQSTSKSHQQDSTAINTYQPHSKCTKSGA